MKNKKIQYYGNYHKIIIILICIIFSISLMIYSIQFNELIWICFLPIILYMVIMLIFIFNYRIVFDYYKERIIALCPGKFKKIVINMKDVQTIEFVEERREHKKGDASVLYPVEYLDDNHPWTYNSGRIFKFIVKIKDQSIVSIPYESFWRSKNEEKIKEKTNEIIKIIEEFNEYKYRKYFKNK